MEGIGLGTSIVLSKQWIHLFNEIRASEGMFSLPLPRGVHSWCCVTSSLSICTAPPAIGAAVPNSCTNGGNKISHWSTAPAEWFFSMRSMMKLDVNWLKHAGWKMVRLWSPHVILSKELWHYYIIMELIFTNGPYISVSYLYMWCTNWYQLHTFWIYIYTHISIKALSILSPRSSCHSPTGTLSAFFEPPRWTTLAQRNRHTGRKSVAKAQFPKRDAKKPCQDWPKRVNTKSGKTMQWHWHVGWQKQESDWVSTWIVFVCIAASPKGRISGAHSHFSGCLLKKPTTCKVHEQLARTCGTFPQLQLAVVPFLLMIMIFLIGVVACCGNLLIHTGSNYPCKIKCMDLRNESTRIRCGKRQHIVSDIKYKLVPLISSVHPSFTSATSITLSSSCMNFMDFTKF